MRPKNIKKNPIIILIIGLIFWITVFVQIILVDPKMVKDLILPNTYLTFFISLWLALFFTTGAWLNRRQALTFSSSLVLFLYLRLSGYGTLLNLLLLIGIITSLEFYFHSQSD